ncbi:xanthine dehydrogenase family protein molybdopterin-binding subunit [Sphingomonas sp. MG17]|uniref:Xanthine dehydrogenase family protein molybdopterin-binding subunit n=1 Tax=Sphingomonas tagetis TaxID=2949092 RepID=A0A9X2HSG4_9SPHN|nr:xanthine dehydrogenase family protein molybdopterin-binding subunit [Sphingomonas tagetis]MCP3732678.1 xanthine dehydrogenase family protein molybdopterin-binding subunit [Sphingomonas tagetis]
MTAVANRRAFLAGTGGLTIGLTLPLGGARAQAMSAPLQPNAFVRVGTDGLVTVIHKHVEFGQGPATGVTTIIADEMDAAWDQMRIAFAPANDPLYKNLAFGTMGVGGSSAIRESWMQMRMAGAAARAMLVEAAAKRWGVPASAVSVANGVVSSGKRKAGFGELAADAAVLPVPQNPTLKTPDKFVYIGKTFAKVDSKPKTDGSALFTQDVRLPGMVHAAVRRPPAFGATVKKVEAGAAKAIPGVIDVKPIPSGVAVYARDTWAAQRGAAALEVDWDLSKAETRSSAQMFAEYSAAARTPGRQVEASGDAAAALAAAARKIDATFYFPFLAHGPMETMDYVIAKKGEGIAVHAGSQFQVGEMRAICGVAGVPFEKSELIQHYAGGSFGRRATPVMFDGTEAAACARAYGFAAPVKVVASRENDLTGGYYRPMTVHRVQAGLDGAGSIAGWDQVIVAKSIMKGTPFEAMGIKDGVDGNMVEGANDTSQYKIGNFRLGQHLMDTKVPVLWWRSVGHTHTAFVKETVIDELLTMAGQDPVDGRLALLKHERAAGVLRKAAEISGFGKRAVKKGRALGVAVHESFDSYVAQVAEVSVGADGLPKVHKVWCAVDCGIAVNPDIIRAQMEGGIGYGLGHALYGEITLGEGGQVQETNFDKYRSLRIGEMPDVEVAIIDSQEKPTGVGEPGVPPIAPAVANAWRKLTGKAVRRLPFAHGDNS